MIRYTLVRLAQMIPTILMIAVFNFVLIHMTPGDPAEMLAGDFATPEVIERARAEMGLDKPLLSQLAIYMSNIVRGDLGYSYGYNRPVLSVILSFLPATLILLLTAQILGIVIGILLGLWAARRYDTWPDSLVTSLLSLVYSLPVFWIGLIAILVFGVQLRVLPTSGMTSFGVDGTLAQILDVLRHLILPAGTLMLVWIVPVFYRITRASLVEVSQADFVVTARAKGLPERTILNRHILPNAVLPTVTMIGLTLGTSVSGAVLTESLFSWPGIGRLMLDSISKRDFPILMGIFLFVSVTVVLATLLTDLVYRWLDPRIDLGARGSAS